jgi:hypothetical protein
MVVLTAVRNSRASFWCNDLQLCTLWCNSLAHGWVLRRYSGNTCCDAAKFQPHRICCGTDAAVKEVATDPSALSSVVNALLQITKT